MLTQANDLSWRSCSAWPSAAAGAASAEAPGGHLRVAGRPRRAALPRVRRPRRLPGGQPHGLLLPPPDPRRRGRGDDGRRRGVRHIVRPEERLSGRAVGAPRGCPHDEVEEEGARCRRRWRGARGGPTAAARRAARGGRQAALTTAAGRLHYVVKQPPAPKDAAATPSRKSDRQTDDDTIPEPEDAIFIHGFTSSSSFWGETVFPESATLQNCRLLAVDLLLFGDSPKPASCTYTLHDHVEAIERSVVEPLDLRSFHLVSHSMGCMIALALAAKHPARVKSITLIAPPYFLPCEEKASQVALSRLAEKKLWPPLLFGSAVMSWYEHIGRTVCFLVCKNHLLWESLYKLLTRKSAVDFVVRDLTRHTHHSAWHTMHNVICRGARLQDGNLEAVAAAGVPVKVIHGVADQVVPVECSHHLKSKLPSAELHLFDGRDHRTVVLSREKEFAEELREFWSSQAVCQKPRLHQGVQQVMDAD